LEEVYFEGNPVQKREMVLYRNKLRLALPQVAKIDACEFSFLSPSLSLFCFGPLLTMISAIAYVKVT
jgi:hypothetical protein